MTADRIVVVGAGPAGLRAAERLRELSFHGEVVVIGDERTGPYHRPALSKGLLDGSLGTRDIALADLDRFDLVWRLDTGVRGVDVGRRVLHLPGGEELAWDGLVLATGAEARRLDDNTHGSPRIVTVRTVADVARIRPLLADPDRRVIVLGTGFTGCEVASTLVTMRKQVTLVGRAGLMTKVLDKAVSGRLTELHRAHGVKVLLGVRKFQWRVRRDQVTLVLPDDEVTGALAVVAVGTVPRTDWLAGSEVPVDNGVVCESTCHVQGLDDVVAAGDVARWPNLLFDLTPRRVEHWTNAVEMGRAAAESLLYGRDGARPFMPVPRFWSEQHGTRIQAVGQPGLGDSTVQLPADRGHVTGHLRAGRTVGVIGVNSPAAVLRHSHLVMRGSPPVVRASGPTSDGRPGGTVPSRVPARVPSPALAGGLAGVAGEG